ncbi:tRNA (guanosine(46)-N7)-methyltransferase TrmB [Lactobacillus sp. W8089]|nr:tRNA (guanosine(46)-N7)-methyltransferase TrmB [Lactobacillus sp. W8086]MBI0109101.1 tRNA (guanosine(46)-N7)-methyltransferase TrmB [Lactobacillus sp. W8085]MBI0112514.1 tRNA (guanosine(46)-N7)-methyltransferase TrmB [Lactobacillus sp. W8088]MBI0116033.1 tRNA (guanosine(46)-N7)-methyltransferase TrmB [Lactobacillus sp. W8087]MBI0119955.1 tRNA (guanosine(46)-N7)-methyltransferase TrmB [Lactobacillus sp. W8089]MBI0131920.1 tRNA (guanosine(46)-N7)-methyltransferase TrmB [Lactobacillus sp. W809
MRLRNKPWAEQLIQKYPELISVSPQNMQGQWQQKFAQKQPLELELGAGKGRFIIQKAQQNPQINYVAMEIQTAAIAMILKQQVELRLPNLHLVQANGRDLVNIFAKGEIEKLYLNFSDPWPKKRHTKRRLTAPNFLKQYQTILQTDGMIEFKTDNQALFEYSLQSCNNYGMKFDKISLNLHHSSWAETNIWTEYEEKFSKKGQPIYFLAARF